MYREAAESDAKTLATFLKKYRQMGVLDFHGYSKKQIFKCIRAYFPTMRKYGYDNFVAYFQATCIWFHLVDIQFLFG